MRFWDEGQRQGFECPLLLQGHLSNKEMEKFKKCSTMDQANSHSIARAIFAVLLRAPSEKRPKKKVEHNSNAARAEREVWQCQTRESAENTSASYEGLWVHNIAISKFLVNFIGTQRNSDEFSQIPAQSIRPFSSHKSHGTFDKFHSRPSV